MKWILCLAAAVATVSLGVKVTHASGPVGVYAPIDKITLEPNADHPDFGSIQQSFGLRLLRVHHHAGVVDGPGLGRLRLLTGRILALDPFLSMKALEPPFWIGGALIVIRILRAGNPRLLDLVRPAAHSPARILALFAQETLAIPPSHCP